MPAVIQAQQNAGTNTTNSTAPSGQSSSTPTSSGGLLSLPTVWGLLGVSQVNWSDLMIRGGLVLVGVVLILIVVGKMLERPAVAIATTAAEEGA